MLLHLMNDNIHINIVKNKHFNVHKCEEGTMKCEEGSYEMFSGIYN